VYFNLIDHQKITIITYKSITIDNSFS